MMFNFAFVIAALLVLIKSADAAVPVSRFSPSARDLSVFNNVQRAAIAKLSRNTDGCPPRVRKAWWTLSDDDKALYLEAVDLFYQKKLNIPLVEQHMHGMTVIEAHNTCGFLIWHRVFTLAFENMLRSMGPRFKCITIPFWDFIRDSAKMNEGKCNSMEECSEFLRAMGGTGTGVWDDTVEINGRRIKADSCCNTYPCKNFCSSENVCPGCIPRGRWNQKPFPPGFSFESVVRSLLSFRDFRSVNYAIQHGAHDEFHSNSGAAFRTFASPADPVFFPFHATIDMFHDIYYQCNLVNLRASNERESRVHKLFQDVRFMQCSNNALGYNPEATHEIMKHLNSNTKPSGYVQADEHPILAPYYAGIGKTYDENIDISNLGVHSYTYERDDSFNQLLSTGMRCNDLAGDHTVVKTSTKDKMKSKFKNKFKSAFHRSLGSKREKLSGALHRLSNYYTKSMDSILERNNGNLDQATFEMEAMACQRYDERFGVPKTFNKEYIDSCHMTQEETRCHEVLEMVKQKKRHLSFSWKRLYKKFFHRN